MTTDSVELDRAKSQFDAAARHEASGDYDAAIAAYLDVLTVVPDLSPVHFNLGNAYFAMRRFEEATNAFRRAVKIDPDAATYNNLGNSLAASGNLDEALTAFRAALVLSPEFRPAINNIGPALFQLGQHDEAIGWLLQAVQRSPNNPRVHAHLGDCFHHRRQFENAMGCYEQSLQLDPQQVDTWLNIGVCQTELNRLTDAAGSYIRAQQIAPDDPRVYNNLGELNRRRGLLTEAGFCYLRALQLAPSQHETHSNCLLTMLYDADVSSKRLLDESKHWARQHAARIPKLPIATNDPTKARRLRVGYLSADFRKHPVGYLLEPVLRCHDSTNVEVYCYANQHHTDELTEVLQRHSDHWRMVGHASDNELAATIRTDEIDILIDLSGHTADHRLRVMARKPAPVQATWIGYSGSTGVPEVDYILADETVIPANEKSFYTERIMQLPNSYVCFGEPVDSPAVTSLPALASNNLTFGCLNHLAKLTPAVIRRWSSVLLAVPESTILLKTPALRDESVCERIRASFGENFVSSDRVRLEGGGSRREMLEAYNCIDIGLDPFPFNGGLTTLEALWMGVPVLTQRGDRFAARASESFLKTIGLEDWVVSSAEAYTAKVVASASDLVGLAELRQSLRQRMLDSPLCDHRNFARQLEAAFRDMWRSWCNR